MTVTIEKRDIGPEVICDFCGDNYTGRKDPGGLLFESKAACPGCAPRIEANAMKDGELRFIRARCPDNVPFAEWCLQLRGGDNSVHVISSDGDESLEELIEILWGAITE